MVFLEVDEHNVGVGKEQPLGFRVSGLRAG
jgi:hypothetical protein